MLWVLQNNIYSERGYDRIVNDLERFGLNYTVVKAIPFTLRLVEASADLKNSSVDIDNLPEPIIDTSKPIIVMGSYSLARIAKHRGWTPGAFLNNLSYDIWSKAWPADILLNPNAKICAVKEAELCETSFVRPVLDSKSFAGKVFNPEEFSLWKTTLVKMTPEDILNGDTEIIISKPVEIYCETRLFIVDGKIITASGYKRGTRVIYDPVVEPDTIEFGKRCIELWQPDRAFVLDVAYTPEGYKIVEINNFNSAGFYAADTQKIVMAIEEIVW